MVSLRLSLRCIANVDIVILTVYAIDILSQYRMMTTSIFMMTVVDQRNGAITIDNI